LLKVGSRRPSLRYLAAGLPELAKADSGHRKEDEAQGHQSLHSNAKHHPERGTRPEAYLQNSFQEWCLLVAI
jgi:hypothetical protein